MKTCRNCFDRKTSVNKEPCAWCDNFGNWRPRRWPIVIIIILIAAILVALTCIVWYASVDPAHNTKPTGRVHYDDVILRQKCWYAISHTERIDGVDYIFVDNVRWRTGQVIVWGFGSDGNAYAGNSDESCTWFPVDNSSERKGEAR
jgi:hypothetical protein